MCCRKAPDGAVKPVRGAGRQGGEVKQKTGSGPAGMGRMQASEEVPDHRRDDVNQGKKTHTGSKKQEPQGNCKGVRAVHRMGNWTI